MGIASRKDTFLAYYISHMQCKTIVDKDPKCLCTGRAPAAKPSPFPLPHLRRVVVTVLTNKAYLEPPARGTRSDSMSCYLQVVDDILRQNTSAPCPKTESSAGYRSCCRIGDACGANGFCWDPSREDSWHSGYYLGGCTDPFFIDSSCRQECAGFYRDVVWDDDANEWHCCEREYSTKSSVFNCQRPLSDGIDDPDAGELFETAEVASVSSMSSLMIASLSSTSSLVTTSSSFFEEGDAATWRTTSSTATSSPTPSSNTSFDNPLRNPPESDLEDPANDSVVVYVASILPTLVGVGAIIVVLLLWRRKRIARRKTHNQLTEQPYGPQTNDVEAFDDERKAGSEIDSRSPMPEMGTMREGGELDSRAPVPELDLDGQRLELGTRTPTSGSGSKSGQSGNGKSHAD